jgi:hypothetical protein
MVRRTNHVGTRCTIGAAFALGVAVLAPATAAADGGEGTPLPVAVTPATPGLAAAVESAVGGGSVVPVVENAVAAVLDGSLATTVDAPEPADEEDEHETASEPPTPPAVPEAAPQRVDTTVQSPDTKSDTPRSTTEPVASTAPPAVAVQISPTNVNVSVRVASPGENGPVTQTNVSATAAVVASTVTPITSSRPGAERPVGGESGSQSAAVSPAESPVVSPPDPSVGTWNWQWDCLSIPSFSTMSPAGSSGGITPTNWIWNWNCGDNTAQYQVGTAAQYRPINVNVGIRISSPGNDGSVTQANVVVAVGVSADAGSASRPPAAASDAPFVWAPAPEEEPASGPPEVSASAAAEVTSGVAAVEAVILLPADEHVEPAHGTSAPTGAFGLLPGAAGIGIVRPALGALRPDAATLPLATVAIRPWSTQGVFGPSAERRARSRSDGAAARKTAPRWTRSGGIRGSITTQSSGTSVAPAGAGGSSSGGLPLVLALPFLAAVLDMARRLALDRVATPSSHRARVPDDPG